MPGRARTEARSGEIERRSYAVCRVSLHVGQPTSHSVRLGLCWWAAGEHGRNRVFQIVRLRRGARPAGIQPLIVNATVIDKMPGLIEDGGFRCDLRPRHFHQLMVRIAQHRSGKGILRDVIANSLRCRGRVGIHQPEIDASSREFFRYPLQLRSVAIGDRAIGAREQEDPGAADAKGWCALPSVPTKESEPTAKTAAAKRAPAAPMNFIPRRLHRCQRRSNRR